MHVIIAAGSVEAAGLWSLVRATQSVLCSCGVFVSLITVLVLVVISAAKRAGAIDDPDESADPEETDDPDDAGGIARIGLHPDTDCG